MDLESYKIEWRSFLFVLGLFTQIRQQIHQCIRDNFDLVCLSRNKYLSVQTNYFIIFWLGFFLLWRNDNEKLNRLTGKVQGALVSYITLVMLAYIALLSATDTSVGWDLFTGYILHYVYPIAFIIDWLVYEVKRYDWSFYISWIVYPLVYLVFITFNGILSLSLGYIYPFMDPNENDVTTVISMVIVLLITYSIIALMYIFTNRKIVANDNE